MGSCRNPGEDSSCTCSPGCEGKVGMAAVQLVPGQAFDRQRLYQHVRTSLPAYAAPHFIRIQVSSSGGRGGWEARQGG